MPMLSAGVAQGAPLSVVVMAGRRIDPPQASQPRFPLSNVPVVTRDIENLLRRRRATTLVSAAACGADLIAQDVARKLGLRRRIVLPFQPAVFRAASVTDRPGDWGDLFDIVIAEVAAAGELRIIDDGHGGLSDPYTATNERLLREAFELSGQCTMAQSSPPALAAAVVWEGRDRGARDYTSAFAELARARGLTVDEVLTL